MSFFFAVASELVPLITTIILFFFVPLFFRSSFFSFLFFFVPLFFRSSFFSFLFFFVPLRITDCGNTNAAQSKKILLSHGITRVVNCKSLDDPNFHESDPDFEYLRFPIAYHRRDLSQRNNVQATLKYFGRLHNWVDGQLADNKSVLIHCLAGAHRAGTASISYLMYAAGLSKNDAIKIAQRQRPVISPIGSFPELLDKLEHALSEKMDRRK